MQPSPDFQKLFDLKVHQCHHILNIYQTPETQIKDMPLHKGNLFLGGVGTFEQPIINGYRITSVLSILDRIMMERYMIKEKTQHLKIEKHKWIDLYDEEDSNISQHFAQTHQFVKEMLKDHNVLIHCQVGVSRSASITIAFIMKQFGLSFKEAFQMVKKRRSSITPNKGFVKQLVQYEKGLKTK